MKKFICLALVIVALAAFLIGCGSFKCDLCGKEKTGGKNEGEVLGQTVTYCDDCAESLDSVGEAFEDLGDEIEDLF